MAHDAELRIVDSVSTNGVSSKVVWINERLTLGRIDIFEGSGTINIFVERSTDGQAFFPIQVRELVGVMGKSLGDHRSSVSFGEAVKGFEFAIEPKNAGYIRYRYEVTGENPSFEIEINHG
jgi:hypothetical protein